MEQILEDNAFLAEITHLPPEVLNLVADGDELLDKDFNVISYINTIFPTEQSLTGLNDKINTLEYEIASIDDEVRGLIKWKGGQDGVEALKRASASIEALMAKVMDMKGRAEQSEIAVRDMTRDIRQLDTAKKNLTQAITTLNHLNMLVSGVDTLQTLVKKRQYGDAANLLQGVVNVVEHFDNYQSIPQISQLSHKVKDIKKELGDQISLEFRESFSTGGSINAKQMGEACLVLDVLEPHIKHDLLQWFVSLQLREYTVLFDENEDLAWLDKVDKRYAWLKKHLIQFEERYNPIFPAKWDLSQRIAISFCHQTRQDLAKVMGKRRHEIDVKLLLGAIQKTCSFENLLFLRFGGHIIEEIDLDSKNPFLNGATSDDDKKNPFLNTATKPSPKTVERKVIPNQFNRIITQSFDPFLYIYIESQDKNLAELIEKFVSELRTSGFPQPQAPDSSAVVLSNCADLFVFYKKCLVQCTQLSCGEPLLNLGHVFSKRLRDYTNKVLQSNLPKVSASATTLASVTNLTRELRDLNTSNLIHNFQSLLKEGENVRFSRYELYRICSILTTSEYCVETTQQLEEKLKEKLSENLSSCLTMDGEKALFFEVIEMCLSLLVHDLDSACDPALTSMTKISWQNIEVVGDQSGYVSAITSFWKVTVPTLRDFLANSRKYFVLFCQQFAKLFIAKYVSTLYKCKGVSKAGAQQLLLDSQSLKTSLLDLPSIALTVKRKPPDKYSKLIVKEMGRTELILKLVMTPIEQSSSSFVDHALKLLPDTDLNEFVKILEMKGIRRAEQIPMVDNFKSKNKNSNSGLASSTSFDEPNESNVESSRIKKLERLIKKRL